MLQRSFFRVISSVIILSLVLTSSIGAVADEEEVKYTQTPVDCSIEAKIARENFYIRNGFGNYDPCSDTCSLSAGSVVRLSGKDNLEKILNYFTARGMSREQAAGIAGSLLHEGGFSPFRQEDTFKDEWPNGGYGIAQFTGGQRAAVTEFLSSKLGATFTQYYVGLYGGGVTVDTGYIPSGIPENINDQFLIGQLDYLYQYMSDFAPSTIETRVTELQQDYKLSIGDGVKLLDYILSLNSAGDVAKVWTYLYEYPAGRKNAAIIRASSAEQIFTNITPSSSSDCGISAGGLSFEQTKALMLEYNSIKKDFFNNVLGNSFWSGFDQVDECTAFVMYFANKYIGPLSNTGNGRSAATYAVQGAPGVYKSVTADQIEPFTIFSIDSAAYGHTGMILGVMDDGSVIVGESNTRWGAAEGLLENESSGAFDGDPGVITSTRWVSIDAWISAWAGRGYSDPTFAAPVNSAEVLEKLQGSVGG